MEDTPQECTETLSNYPQAICLFRGGDVASLACLRLLGGGCGVSMSVCMMLRVCRVCVVIVGGCQICIHPALGGGGVLCLPSARAP